MEPVKLTYEVPVPREAAFYLFVRHIDEWWPSVLTHNPGDFRGMRLSAHVGGQLTSFFDSGDVVWGEVICLRAPRRISWLQWWRQSPERPSQVDVEFSETETGTRVHFEHGGWNTSNSHYRQRFVEWPTILSHYVSLTRAHARGNR